MKAIAPRQILENLTSGKLPGHILHVDGSILNAQGESFPPERVEILLKNGFSVVYMVEKEGEEHLLRARFRREPIPLADLREGVRLSRPVHSEEGDLLLAEGTTLSAASIKQLADRGIDTLYITKPKESIDAEARKVRNYRARLGVLQDLVKRMELQEGDIDPRRILENPAHFCNAERMRQHTEKQEFTDEPAAPALKPEVKVNPFGGRVEEVKKTYLEIYDEALDETEKIFGLIADRQRVDGKVLAKMTKKVVAALIEDRVLLLNLVNLKEQREYLVNHAVNVAVLAVNIACQLEYSQSQVMEVGVGAFLHDVGMLFVPAAIRDKPAKLDSSEMMEVYKHPGHGLSCLERLTGIPRSVPYVVYQAHERLDRSGYPNKRPDFLIHRFARVIAVADTYDAMTWRRPYRPARLPYEATEEILRMVSRKRLDKEAVVALLQVNSLFPIGSWVRLTDGRVAKVIGACEAEYTRPVVVPYLDEKGEPIDSAPVDLNANGALGVASALDPAEVEDELMKGF